MTAVLSEIETLESAEWPARLRVYRPLAEYMAHCLGQRWQQAQQAAHGIGLGPIIFGVPCLQLGLFGGIGQRIGQAAELVDQAVLARGSAIPGPSFG